MPSKTESNERTRRTTPHKVKTGLENIILAVDSAEEHWRDLVAHAERKGDISAAITLAKIRDDLGTIERNARAARNGEEA